MSNKIVLVVTILGFFGAGIFLGVNLNSQASNESELDYLRNTYGEIVLESFYSLTEIRPYSIIQLDKTIELYDNTWLKPNDLVNMLSEEEKNQLYSSINQLIEDYPRSKRAVVINKIRNWCIARNQFEYLDTNLGINENVLIDYLVRVEETESLLDKFDRSGSLSFEQLTDSNKDEAYHSALDRLSEMNLKEQMIYYSKLYSELSSFDFLK